MKRRFIELTAFLLLGFGSVYIARWDGAHGAPPQAVDVTSMRVAQVRHPVLPSLTDAVLGRMHRALTGRTEGALGRAQRNPDAMRVEFDACKADLRQALGPGFAPLSDTDLSVVFVSLVAHRWAPYGCCKGAPRETLADETALDCAKYVMLTGQLAARFPAGRHGRLRPVGFDGGAVGNHAQVLYESPGDVSLLLDPTIGLVARTDFNSLLRGQPVPPEDIAVMFCPDHENIRSFKDRVVAALLNGAYAPSDLLYYFDSFDAFVTCSDEIGALWNTDLEQALKCFVTPGGVTLRQRLLPHVPSGGGVCTVPASSHY